MTAITFLLLGGLLTWFVIGSKGSWQIKLLAICAVTAFTLALWLARASGNGYPVRAMPARALFVWAAIREPDPKTGDPGRIYIWLIPPGHERNPFAYNHASDEPRAYRQPYSRGLQQQLENAMHGVRQGQRVELRRRPGRAGRGSRGHYVAYRLPPAAAPRKGT